MYAQLGVVTQGLNTLAPRQREDQRSNLGISPRENITDEMERKLISEIYKIY